MELFKILGTIAVNGADKANSDIDKVSTNAKKSGNTIVGALKRVGTAVVTYMSVKAIADFGQACVDAASKAETAFAKVNTLLAAGTNTDAYFNDIKAASNETGVAVEDFSEAVYSAISASVDQADAVDFTAQAIKLAKGGFTDAATAVDVLTTAINAYGLDADAATSISDKLITTQNLGKTTVNELASAMGRVIPTAKAFSVDIDTLCGSYAVMTKNGIATAETTTYMNSMLNELGKSGTTASDVLKEKTGKSFSELMESGSSLSDVLAVLQSAANESGVALGDMFGSAEAAKAANVLASNTDDLTSSIQAMADSSGATETAYSTMADTMAERTQKLKNKLENIIISIGEKLMPVVEKAIQIVVDNMPLIESMMDQIAPVMATLFDTILPPLLQLAADILPLLMDMFNAIMPVITQLITALMPVIVQLIQTLLPPIIQIVQTLLPPLLALLQPILDLLTPLIELLQPILDLVVAVLEPIATLISDLITPLISIISQLIQVALVPLKNWWTILSDVMSNTVSAAVELIMSRIDTIKDVFSGLIQFIKGVFTGDWEAAWDGIKNIFSSIWEGIKTAFKIPINWIIDGINAFIRGINRIKIPNWVPVVGGKGFSIAEIPELEQGGILEKGQTGFLEGNGAEAVVPLHQNKKWIHAVAEDMDNAMGGSGSAVVAVLQDILDQLIVISGMGITLDTGALVGALANPMDVRLGKIRAQKARA